MNFRMDMGSYFCREDHITDYAKLRALPETSWTRVFKFCREISI